MLQLRTFVLIIDQLFVVKVNSELTINFSFIRMLEDIIDNFKARSTRVKIIMVPIKMDFLRRQDTVADVTAQWINP